MSGAADRISHMPLIRQLLARLHRITRAELLIGASAMTHHLHFQNDVLRFKMGVARISERSGSGLGGGLITNQSSVVHSHELQNAMNGNIMQS